MSQDAASCARVTSSVAGAPAPDAGDIPETQVPREARPMTARVGRKAPDFTAPAYHKGGFGSVSLSDSLGKWVLLCFYPGDFTFV